MKQSLFIKNLKRKIGKEKAIYHFLFDTQRGVCAICGKPQTGNRRLAIDHCHKTNKIRGLLCTKCNVAIGLLQENSYLIEKAADYVRHHGR